MLQQPQLEKDIQRSLDRLQHFLAQNGNNLPDLIPSLYYSVLVNIIDSVRSAQKIFTQL